jgi:transposase
MAKRYRPVRRDQRFLLPPDMGDWLPADHPVWLVITVVADHLDTSAFHAGRRTGGAGAAGYDPDMLITLLVWAYANGMTSSRRIEAACRTDVAFAVICALDVPDHVTIARFRAAFGEAAAALFTQVLILCARLGMGQIGTVALDGTKITASASKAANRTEAKLAELAAAAVAAHAAADAAQDARFGEGQRGDRVPPGSSGGSRGERIAAALASLAAERAAAAQAGQAKAETFRARLAAGQATGPAPAAAQVELARERLARAEAAQQAKIAARDASDAAALAAGRRIYQGSCRPRPQTGPVARARAKLERAEARAAERERRAAAARGPGPVRNITDPDSRLMPTRAGFIQGYNPQNVTSEDLLIIATELTTGTTDSEWFEPMLRKAQHAAALITAHHPPSQPATGASETTGIELILADAGYLSEHNLTTSGPDRLIATGKNRGLRHTAADPRRSGGTANGPAVQAMAARLATPAGITTYRQRGHIAETPHGHIKHNMRFRQLSVRGKPKAAAEWTFICTVHNLAKAITTGHLTRHTLATLS